MPPNESAPAFSPDACSVVAGWTMHACGTVASTNDAAAALPAWHAVRADSQTAGRGRWRRPWISDRGGLWLSAVLPTPGEAARWRALPLAVGLAVTETVAALGVTEVRLRWPNDVLVRDRKLAGLLLDCFQPGLTVAGIGVNVTNTPEIADDSLRGTTTRLADLVPSAPGLDALTGQLLTALRRVHETMDRGGFAALLPAVNALWRLPRRVELDLDGSRAAGRFQGVDATGRLALENHGRVNWFDPVQVVQLREIAAT
jgi:BirA family biotin operon repressor/biotin-[acetyl-CoA-carboxylase] ligase